MPILALSPVECKRREGVFALGVCGPAGYAHGRYATR